MAIKIVLIGGNATVCYIETATCNLYYLLMVENWLHAGTECKI